MSIANQVIPDYQEQLGAYHRGFEREIEAIINVLPIKAGQRVLDMACGDGTHTAFLAERVGPEGRVVGVDRNAAYLEMARTHVERRVGPGRAHFVQGSIDRLPCATRSFDVAFCAHSLYSLPEPVEALRALNRQVKKTGVVAVLENDTLHQLILPWPVELELAVRVAEFEAIVERSAHPRKHYVARQLPMLFTMAGLERPWIRSFAHDRIAPLPPDERLLISGYLRDLGQRVRHRLSPDLKTLFDHTVDPESPGSMLRVPDLAFTWIDQLVIGYHES